MLFPDEDNAGCDEINGQWLNGRQVIERTLGRWYPCVNHVMINLVIEIDSISILID
jgi:hypothetical protein